MLELNEPDKNRAKLQSNGNDVQSAFVINNGSGVISAAHIGQFDKRDLTDFSSPLQPLIPCKPPNHSFHPFGNTSIPVPARATSPVSILSLPEKLLLLSDNSSAISRIGVTHCEWWSESLNGLTPNGPGMSLSFTSGPVRSASVFPQLILVAASFNRRLWYDAAASAIAAEANFRLV